MLYYKYRSQQTSRTAKMLTGYARKKSAKELYDQNADGMRGKSQQNRRTAKMLTVMRQKSQQKSRTAKMLTVMRRKSQQNNRPVPNADLIAINYTFQNRGKK